MAQPRPEGCRPLGERDPHQSRWAYATIYTEQSIRFIEQSVQAGRPFYINVMYNAPLGHATGPIGLTGARQRRTLLANADDPPTRDDYRVMVEAMDTGVGQILRALQRLGVADNTLVIFTNDNGGEWLSEQGGAARSQVDGLRRRRARAGARQVAGPYPGRPRLTLPAIPSTGAPQCCRRPA